MLLETGLGGRLDATNVIDRPIATVITPVSMDHMEFLGNTLTAIAGEKAAIIKRDAPVICAEQAPEAMAVIEAQAKPHARAAACGRAAMACQRRARAAGLSGRARPDGSRGAKTVRPASVRQCRACDRDVARDRCVQDRHAGVRGRHRQRRMAGADAAAGRGRAGRSGAEGLRDLARRRAQCRRRPRRGCGARRSRRAGVAPAGGDRGHDGEQGCAARSSPISPA